MKKQKLSSCERHNKYVEHTHFTKLVKRYGFEILDFYNLKNVFLKTNVSRIIGCLPPELCALVDKKDIASFTNKFFYMLDFFVVDQGEELKHHTEMKYYLTDIGELFNTLCVLETYERLPNLDYAYREWGGSVGDVYKLTFPEIHAEYALKVFKPQIRGYSGHGPEFEILTAFCANKSEPKRNNPVYIASLFGGNQFMLSKWQHEKLHKPITINDLFIDVYNCPVYQTAHQEMREDNYINGKRIDFGETYKTKYGKLSYKGRKFFRKFRNMSEKDIMLLKSQQKNNFDRADFNSAYLAYRGFCK